MPAPMKTHRTNAKTANIVWHGAHYAVPLTIIAKYKVASSDDDESVSTINEAFGDLFKKYGKQGVLLKGLRHKEGLSQVELAEIIGVTQANLSAMENGHRNIGKEIAKRIQKKFGLDYRLFL